MRFNRFFVLLLFLFIVGASTVTSVGIGQFFSNKVIPFQPGAETELKLSVFDSSHIRVALEGDLAQYSSIIDVNPNGGPRTVTIRLKFPDFLEPGEHVLYLVATESTGNAAEQAIGGLASVRAGVRVYALYPAKHPLFQTIVASDININETTEIGLGVTNYGEDKIDSAYGVMKIYNQDNVLVATLNTDSASISSYDTVTMTKTLNAAAYNLTPGKYRVNGTFMYDGAEYPETKEGNFRVGQMNIDVIDSTKEVIINSTNKFKITLESDWAGSINDVYARISMPNGKILKTPNADLVSPGSGRKGASELETYWETEGLSPGTYDVEVNIYYNGKSVTKTVKVNVINGVAPVIEKPKKAISSTLIIIIVSIIILAGLVIYFLTGKKNGTSPKTSNNVSDGEIKPPSL